MTIGLLGNLSAFAADIVNRNSEDSVRVTSAVTTSANFLPLDLGEWIKKVTDSDFVEVSSMSGKFANYVPTVYSQASYTLQFIIHKNGHFFTAKCRDITDFPYESHVMIRDEDCRWWDESGHRALYAPFNNENIYKMTQDMFFTYHNDSPRSVN